MFLRWQVIERMERIPNEAVYFFLAIDVNGMVSLVVCMERLCRRVAIISNWSVENGSVLLFVASNGPGQD
jgi:hypothetical protein